MKRLFLKVIREIIGRTTDTCMLESLHEECAKALGVGSGAFVASSGEIIVLERIRSLLPAQVCLFDVGANIGKYSEILEKLFSDRQYQIHAFEPSRATMELFASNPDLKNKGQIQQNNFALGRCDGEFTLFSDSNGSGLASMTKRRLDHFNIAFDRSEVCKVETLDNYCAMNNIKRIDLLKVDVEGHELDVLEGARKMFSSEAIQFVQFEFGGCNIDTKTFIQDFFYFFKPFNFKIYRITPSGTCQHLSSYRECYEQFITTNFLAVHSAVPFAS